LLEELAGERVEVRRLALLSEPLVGFVNSGGLVFVDESAEQVAAA
jgi:hypothetical protein